MTPTGPAQPPEELLELEHPTELPLRGQPSTGSAGEDLAPQLSERDDDLQMVEHTLSNDQKWHFAVALAKDSEVIPRPIIDPSPDAPTQTLGLFRRANPAADVEVVGHLLDYDIEPEDWLLRELLTEERTIRSRKPKVMQRGTVGDILATWTLDEEAFVGRYVATKWGPRLFLVCCRTRLADYPQLADEFLRCAASFQALDNSFGAFAEKVNFVKEKLPLPWKVAVLQSWDIQRHPAEPEGAWFEAAHVAPAPIDEQAGEIDGRLSYAVMARSVAQRPRDAGNVLLRALRDSGVIIGHAAFERDDTILPVCRTELLHAWSLTTPIEREGASGELRCRVLLHDHAWVVAGVFGPAVDQDDDAWMRNKRVLDVVTTTLELGNDARSAPPDEA